MVGLEGVRHTTVAALTPMTAAILAIVAAPPPAALRLIAAGVAGARYRR